MNNARSINQNALPDMLPNFRNIGVALRIVLFSIGLVLFQAFLQARSWVGMPQYMMNIAALLVPILLVSLLLLWVAQPWLYRIGYWRGVLAVNTLVVVLTLSIYLFGGDLYRPMGGDSAFDLARYALLGAFVCSIQLLYFRLRTRLLSRALDDARLQVLRARIRPHFLFNTINAVLGIMRTQPRQAETALEDMADLFRVAMSDERDLVTVGQEIKLTKQYVALEQLRIGDRLRVDWQIRDVPDDALIPPLLLQPLLENAVYHGIEQLTQGGSISIELHRSGDELQLKVENPCPLRAEVSHQGNKVALRNIRERLDLLFDVEARYQFESGKDFYRVEITLPYIRERRDERRNSS